MLEIIGDIWKIDCDAICIPTNDQIDGRGNAVMGAGLAKQAADRFPVIKQVYGLYLSTEPSDHVFLVHTFIVNEKPKYLIAFQTKYHWKDPAQIDLIKQSAEDLVGLTDWEKFNTVLLPRVGCGLGGLDWEKQVKPVLAFILDDRFIVVSQRKA